MDLVGQSRAGSHQPWQGGILYVETTLGQGRLDRITPVSVT